MRQTLPMQSAVDGSPDATRPYGEPETSVVAVAADAGPSGLVPVAWITASMNAAAETAARRIARGAVVAVAMSKITLLRAVAAGDSVCCHTAVARFGTTSITLSVEAWASRPDEVAPAKVTGAEYTFVAVDEDGRPRSVLTA